MASFSTAIEIGTQKKDICYNGDVVSVVDYTNCLDGSCEYWTEYKYKEYCTLVCNDGYCIYPVNQIMGIRYNGEKYIYYSYFRAYYTQFPNVIGKTTDLKNIELYNNMLIVRNGRNDIYKRLN